MFWYISKPTSIGPIPYSLAWFYVNTKGSFEVDGEQKTRKPFLPAKAQELLANETEPSHNIAPWDHHQRQRANLQFCSCLQAKQTYLRKQRMYANCKHLKSSNAAVFQNGQRRQELRRPFAISSCNLRWFVQSHPCGDWPCPSRFPAILQCQLSFSMTDWKLFATVHMGSHSLLWSAVLWKEMRAFRFLGERNKKLTFYDI